MIKFFLGLRQILAGKCLFPRSQQSYTSIRLLTLPELSKDSKLLCFIFYLQTIIIIQIIQICPLSKGFGYYGMLFHEE